MSIYVISKAYKFDTAEVREETWGSVWKWPDDYESIMLQVKQEAPPTVPSWWKYSDDERFVICLR